MLTEELKRAVSEAYISLAKTTPSFKSRAAQREMIATITRNLAHVHDAAEAPNDYKPPLIVLEGPTGVGKTLGYLIASIPVAKLKRKKLVVSTATVALQEQLFSRDLPTLKERSGLNFSFGLAKGRQRYLCPNMLDSVCAGTVDLFGEFEDTESFSNDSQPIKIFESLAEAFVRQSWDGDRDTWPEPIEADNWSKVTIDASGCMGRNCSYFECCPFYKARKEIEGVDVIVANHDLVLTSLRFGGGVLPPAAETIYIFDEAHHIANKALNHQAYSSAIKPTQKWISKSAGIAKAGMTMLAGNKDFSNDSEMIRKYKVDKHSTMLDQHMKELKALLDSSLSLTGGNQEKDAVWRFKHGLIPEPIEILGQMILSEANMLHAKLDLLKEQLKERMSAGSVNRSAAEKLMPKLGVMVNQAHNLINTWSLFTKEDNPQEMPNARWIVYKKNEINDFVISASPISAAQSLTDHLWNHCAGAVLTSATITAMGAFKRFAEQSGLYDKEKACFQALQSPFDFQKNAQLHIPHLNTDPGRKEEFTTEMIQWISQNIDHREATLVLFSSYWQMNQVYSALPVKLKSIALMQGQMSKSSLLEKHIYAVEAGRGSLILGVDAMSEGVDLPGKYLTHVVITKIPFSVPNEPVPEALSEYLEATGRNPFMEIAVPDASIKMVQSAGRLIRSETDTGRVTVLDRRLLTKRYGQAMLDDLPPMRRCFS